MTLNDYYDRQASIFDTYERRYEEFISTMTDEMFSFLAKLDDLVSEHHMDAELDRWADDGGRA